MIVGLGLGVAASSHFVVSAVAEVIRAKKGIFAAATAQVDTAQSKFGGGSLLVDGDSDYLYINDNMQIAGNGEDFTIELWIRWNSTSGSQGIISDRPPTTSGYTSPNFYLEKNSSNGFYFGYSGGGDIITSNSLVTTGVWYHLAVVRSSGTTKFYLDGTQQGGTLSRTGVIGDGTLSIGAIVGLYVNGWMDEVRISNTARYTANFTSPTAPFVNDEDTLLLLHMDGTDGSTVFEDDNGVRAKKGILAGGNAQVDTAQSKFGGSSALFDGTGDYLRTPSNSAFAFGTGDFTIEYFMRPNTLVSFDTSFDARNSGEVAPVIYTEGTTLKYGRGNTEVIAGGTLSTGTWYHVAVCRSGTSTRLFLDGTQVGSTYTDTGTYVNISPVYIGSLRDGSGSFDGHIDEVRVSNSARYTANFTAPTAPFVNDENTVLLLHMDGTDGSTYFEDDNGVRAKKGVTAIADTQIDTAQSKFGGASALFDGSGDELIVASSSDFAMGTGDWTIEFWVRTNVTGNQDYFDYRPTTPTQQIIYASGTNLIYYQNGAARITGTSVLSSNTWHHIAVARSGSSTKMFVDGTQVGSTWTDTVNYSGVDVLEISNTALGAINGHMDELRWSKGIARYTANFTAPTAPFQNDSYTVLLLHMDGTDGSTVFTDDNGVPPDYDYGA